MKTKASIAVILAGILWGCITLFVRRLSAAGLTSMQIALARLAVSAVLFSLFLLIRDPSRFRIDPKRTVFYGLCERCAGA